MFHNRTKMHIALNVIILNQQYQHNRLTFDYLNSVFKVFSLISTIEIDFQFHLTNQNNYK